MNNISKWLFFVPDHLREEIEGDLMQRFERDVRTKGRSRAKVRLFVNVLRFFRPGIIFRKNHNKRPIPVFMLKNYFVIAIRNMMAHKTSSAINILSLIVGITSALIMISVIRYELSFDSFHSNANRIYRINRHNPGFDSRESGIAYPVTAAFAAEVPAVERFTGVQYYGGIQVDVESNGVTKKFRETKGVAFADNEFFKVFDFHDAGLKWISGNPNTALKDAFVVVITESIAKKYFGDSDALGKTIRLEGWLNAKVTGVVTDLPVNTDLPITIFVSYATLYEIEDEQKMKDDWNSINSNHQGYVLIPENTPPSVVEEQMDKVHAAHVTKDLSDSRKYRLQPLSDVHKDARLNNFNGRTADTTTLWIMAITGLLLLAVGCINYVNLATAQSTLRGREIGVRKVLGSLKKQIILQFLSETFILVVIACVISLFLAEIAIVSISDLINFTLLRHLFTEPLLLMSLGALVVVLTVMTGFYPAIVVSAYGIIDALKGKSGGIGSNFLRKSLVVVQFSVTQIFLIGAFIVISQLKYSRTMDLGFEKDMILNVAVYESSAAKNQQLRSAILTNPYVTMMSMSSTLPSGKSRNRWWMGMHRKETPKEQEVMTEFQAVDTAFFNLYGIQFVAGKNFANRDTLNSVVINEAATANLKFKSPADAIGSMITLDGKDYPIIGVIKNFHNSSTRNEISSMAFVNRPSFYFNSSLKLNVDPKDLAVAVSSIEKVWTSVYPNMLFDYDFFDENIERFYQQEKKMSTLLQIFSGVFLVLACLGLYGLLSFAINRRTKEMAIRKVFGARLANIIELISRDYVLLILLSFAIAAPVSYYFMKEWLDGFSFHIPITWWVFVAPGALALAIAMMTLSGKLLKAASGNPADTLKHE